MESSQPRVLPIGGGRAGKAHKPVRNYAVILPDCKTAVHIPAQEYRRVTVESEDEINYYAYEFLTNGAVVAEMQATEVKHIIDTDTVDLPAFLQAIRPRPTVPLRGPGSPDYARGTLAGAPKSPRKVSK